MYVLSLCRESFNTHVLSIFVVVTNIMKNVYYSCITNCSRHWITYMDKTDPFPGLRKFTFYRGGR